VPAWAKNAVLLTLRELGYLWPSLLNVIGLGAIGLAGAQMKMGTSGS
jgi:hypothetical protein